VKEITIDGIPARITDQAWAVIDVFRYRNKVGLDVALEALKDSLRKSIVTRGQLRKTADVMRVFNVMRPYLEAYSASGDMLLNDCFTEQYIDIVYHL